MIKRLEKMTPYIRYFRKTGIQQLLFWCGAVVIALAAILFAKISTFGNGLFSTALDLSPSIVNIVDLPVVNCGD